MTTGTRDLIGLNIHETFLKTKEDKMKKIIQKLVCYQCERWFPKILATYFPFGMSDDPFRPLCPACSDLIEAVTE